MQKRNGKYWIWILESQSSRWQSIHPKPREGGTINSNNKKFLRVPYPSPLDIFQSAIGRYTVFMPEES